MVRTRILEFSGGVATTNVIKEAARALEGGKLVVFPTETVYGLGCNSSEMETVERLFSVKGRPWNKPLAFYISSRDEVLRYVDKISPLAERVMDQYWPGPLTILLPGAGSRGSVGFRFPDDKTALSLISEAGIPLVATSANRSGGTPPISGEEAVEEMTGLVDVIVKAGKTRYGKESTLIDLCGSKPRVIREGVISAGEISDALGIELATDLPAGRQGTQRAPGR